MKTYCSNNVILYFFSPYLFDTAFWGESDDSNSEIEAALRPQPFYTNIDDIEDSCDWYFTLQIYIYFFYLLHYITASFQAVCLSVIHPLTIVLVVCIVNHMRSVS